jgi:peptidoglycan/LPS O-acetylase OafA/YrhL
MQEAGERAGGVNVANSGSRDEHLRQDLPALTGLRFVAAFSVLIGHGFAWILADHETPGGIVFWVSQISGFGMTLFFVLSGFVIHYNYGKLVTTKRLRGVAAFLWARFARLYPLFLLMMLVYVALSSRTLALLSGNPERFGSILQALPYFLLSIHTWLYTLIGENPIIDAIGGGSPITWSISTEWFFYFAYPLVAWLILRAHATTRGRACFALVRTLDRGDGRPLRLVQRNRCLGCSTLRPDCRSAGAFPDVFCTVAVVLFAICALGRIPARNIGGPALY